MDEAPMLICYDGSDGARHAIDSAVELLGARPAVVLDVGPVLTPAESAATLAPVPVSFEEVNGRAALRTAEEGAEYARSAGLPAEARAGVAAPVWQGIVDVAEEIAAAVIVMGSRGLNGAKELLEGSVSHEVAMHAGRPVLIVGAARHA
jgi:nucleotide-binding universal stress UspA family protein